MPGRQFAVESSSKGPGHVVEDGLIGGHDGGSASSLQHRHLACSRAAVQHDQRQASQASCSERQPLDSSRASLTAVVFEEDRIGPRVPAVMPDDQPTAIPGEQVEELIECDVRPYHDLDRCVLECAFDSALLPDQVPQVSRRRPITVVGEGE